MLDLERGRGKWEWPVGGRGEIGQDEHVTIHDNVRHIGLVSSLRGVKCYNPKLHVGLVSSMCGVGCELLQVGYAKFTRLNCIITSYSLSSAFHSMSAGLSIPPPPLLHPPTEKTVLQCTRQARAFK